MTKADEIPTIDIVLSPDYVLAKKGLRKLESIDSLQAGDDGFKEIARLCVVMLSKENSPKLFEKYPVVHIRYEGSRGSFATSKGIISKLPVIFHFSNGQEFNLDIKYLTEEIRQLRKMDYSYWSYFLFVLGIALFIANYIVSSLNSNIRL